MPKVLIIEDDSDLAQGLVDNLEIEGYGVEHFAGGPEAAERVKSHRPDLILLDVMLPGMDGFEVCRAVRAAGLKVPIIMLTARSQEMDIVRGLELGADDYVTKPFGLRELLARIKAALRRHGNRNESESSAAIGSARVDFARGEIFRAGETFSLGHCEIEILRLLMARPGVHITRAEMLKAIWGDDAVSSDRAVDNHIVSLRRKVELNPKRPKHLLTVHGVGYKFVP